LQDLFYYHLEKFIIPRKPISEELEQKNKDLEKEAVNCKRTEKALMHCENRFKNIINSIKELLVLLDKNFKIQLINTTLAQAYNISLDEYTGKHCYELFYGLNHICKGCPAVKVLNDGEVTSALRYRPDGCIYERTIYPYIEDNGNITGVIVIGSDVTQQKQAEKELREREKELKRKNIRLEEMNAALKVLLEKREEDKKELEEKVMTNIKELVFPYVTKLKNTGLNDRQEIFADIIQSNIEEIISPFAQKLSHKYLNFTPTELKVAYLVKQGLCTKDIADLMGSSPETITGHRKSMRKKLKLTDKKSNLRTHLLSLANGCII
jgi:PAS domain S-box-containing protein